MKQTPASDTMDVRTIFADEDRETVLFAGCLVAPGEVIDVPDQVVTEADGSQTSTPRLLAGFVEVKAKAETAKAKADDTKPVDAKPA